MELTVDELEVKRFMQTMVDARTHFQNKLPQGLSYWCIEDLLLQHGTWYRTPAIKPKLRRGIPRYCYHNSVRFGSMDRRYVEGIAYNGTIPVLHAWNINDAGEVLDSTWQNSGTAYCGIEFPLDYACARVLDEASCLNDWRRDFPMLSKPFKPVRGKNELTATQVRQLNRLK